MSEHEGNCVGRVVCDEDLRNITSASERSQLNWNAENTSLSIAPFTATQEGPDVVVFPQFDIELFEILTDGFLDLDGFDEQDGPVESNIQVGVEKRVKRNILSAQVEHIGYRAP